MIRWVTLSQPNRHRAQPVNPPPKRDVTLPEEDDRQVKRLITDNPYGDDQDEKN